jgi:hypothetical protein
MGFSGMKLNSDKLIWLQTVRGSVGVTHIYYNIRMYLRYAAARRQIEIDVV